MPHLMLPEHQLFYQVDGGDTDEASSKPWLVFCNSLGTDLTMWDRQVGYLSKTYRILRYDRRGHGRSTAPLSPFALSDLGTDVLSLFDALGIDRSHFCGLSIGGLTGLWLCVNARDRLDRVILSATSARIGSAENWNARMSAVRAHGLGGLASATRDRWFSAAFAVREAEAVQHILDVFEATSINGYVGCCAALADGDLREEIDRISNPLLAISGDDDPVCPPSDLVAIAEAVQDGRHVSLPGRHLVNVEAYEAFNAVLTDFLTCSASAEDVAVL